ncbi:F-box protein At3g07870-like [Papaver somniferum]|uniref:F-box protein At3g07870-like n=1 Tax=Papaver somniferum TaxID=3469 RepID=UPI000E702B80|nr:F-box protein At3g07870-like [Papaver somniferum]
MYSYINEIIFSCRIAKKEKKRETVLFRLPVDAAIQAKRVCKTWREIIRNKTEKPGGFLFGHYVSYRLIKQLLFYEDDSKLMNYYSDNMETENSRFITETAPKSCMVGSCNGLVCFGKYYAYSPYPFLVCNPFTGESVCLPEFNYSELPGSRDISSTRKPYGRLVSGFGYCPSTNDYKVVKILYCKEERECGHVHVYTLGAGKWSYVGFTGHRCVFSYLSGIYANGALFWLHQSSKYRVHESEIVAFDLKGEKFHYIALPRCEDFEYTTDYNSPLKLLGGNNNLYLAHAYNGGCRTDIWVYNRNKIFPHWHKEFSIKY